MKSELEFLNHGYLKADNDCRGTVSHETSAKRQRLEETSVCKNKTMRKLLYISLVIELFRHIV